MTKRKIIPANASNSKRRRHALGTVLLVAAVLCAAALLVLVYGTETVTWGELFSLAGLTPGTAQSGPAASGGLSGTGLSDGTGGAPTDGAQTLGPGEAAVTVLDVGQGDAILIETSGMAVLIDGGDYFAGDALCETLRAREIERLDYVFSTHPHRDHLGGLVDVLERFEVGRLYITTWSDELTPTGSTFLRFLETVDRRGVDLWRASTGEVIELDAGALTVISAGGYDELNDCSLVLRYAYGETAFLFMGDAGFDIENRMLADGAAARCDLLKAGHHGSRYATGEAFLAAVSPAYVAASCGQDNQYGYPAPDFVARVESAGARLLRTDRDGDLRFVSDGETVRYVQNTEQEAA